MRGEANFLYISGYFPHLKCSGSTSAERKAERSKALTYALSALSITGNDFTGWEQRRRARNTNRVFRSVLASPYRRGKSCSENSWVFGQSLVLTTTSNFIITGEIS